MSVAAGWWRRNVLAGLFAALVLPAVAHEHAPAAGVVSLDVQAEGDSVHLLTGESPALLYRHSEDGGAAWSEPVRVDERKPAPFSLHRGLDAQIAAAADHLVAVWMTEGTDKWGSGPMATALSADGGKTWVAGPNPADDGSTTGHGFIDIAADDTGTFHLTWLDSRDGRQGLRYARSSDHGQTWSANETLKKATCECCANALATAPGGTVAILYRDREPRDMGFVTLRDGGKTWSEPARVGAFGWELNACPHTGGGVAISQAEQYTGPGRTMQTTFMNAVVWTGKAGSAGVHPLRSLDFGATWKPNPQLGRSSASHPALAANGQRLAAVWDEPAGDKGSIWSATSSDAGATWSEPKRLSAPEASASHPLIVATDSGFRVFWTESRPESAAAWATVALP